MAYTGSTAAILSNYSEVLKTFYLPAIREQLNTATALADIIEKTEEDVSGKNFTINCHYGRSSGTGARADGGALPEADYQKYKTATIPMRYNYGRVTFSGPTIAATRDERGSYASVVDNEIKGITQDLMRENNRQLWGTGYGVLMRWVSGGSGTEVIQKAYQGNSVGGDGYGSTFGAKYLKENTKCVANICVTSSGISTMTVDTTELTVSAITESATYDTITITNPSLTEAAGSYYVRTGSARSTTSATAAGYGRLEMMGLRGIVTNTDVDDAAYFDGTTTGDKTNADPLQGLTIGTYTWWKAIVDAHSAGRYGGQRAITFQLMQKMFDKVEITAGKGYGPEVIMTTHAIRREVLDLFLADRRYVNEMKIDGGWSGIDFNGVPILVDEDAIDGEMYFLTTKDLAIYRMSDWDWMDKDGAILSRITSYDAYEAVLFRYAELGCRRRNSQAVLCDLQYTN